MRDAGAFERVGGSATNQVLVMRDAGEVREAMRFDHIYFKGFSMTKFFKQYGAGTWLFLAALAVFAAFALAGHPLLSPEILGGMAAIPMLAGEITYADILKQLDEQGDAMKAWKDGESKRLDDIEKKLGRPGATFSDFGNKSGADPEYKAAFEHFLRTGREDELKVSD